MSEKPLVYVVENDRFSPNPLRRLVESLGYPTHGCRSGKEFLAQLGGSLSKCCAVVDFESADVEGPQILRAIAKQQINLPIIAAVDRLDADEVCTAIRLGAVDLLQKPLSSGRMRDALERAHLAASFDSQLSEARACYARLATLSDREREIVTMASAGIPNKRMAAQLNCSTKTVEKWRRSAYAALDVTSTAEMTRVVVLAERYPCYQHLALRSAASDSPWSFMPSPSASESR